MKKKMLSAVFVATVFAIFCISGNLEQGVITHAQAIIYSAIIFAVMAYSGFKSGMLGCPDRR